MAARQGEQGTTTKTRNSADAKRSAAQSGSEGLRRSRAAKAVLVGGAAAATAGALYTVRKMAKKPTTTALARRNGAEDGASLNAVMANAVTACELANGEASDEQPGRRDFML